MGTLILIAALSCAQAQGRLEQLDALIVSGAAAQGRMGLCARTPSLCARIKPWRSLMPERRALEEQLATCPKGRLV